MVNIKKIDSTRHALTITPLDNREITTNLTYSELAELAFDIHLYLTSKEPSPCGHLTNNANNVCVYCESSIKKVTSR